MSLFDLTGRCYVVTGSTRSIGLAISRQLLQLNARVLIVSRTQSDVQNCVEMLEDEIAQSSSDEPVLGCCCDVSTSEGRTALLKNATEAFDGRLDGLINNVGYNTKEKHTIEEQTELEYREIMMTNVDSAYYLCKLFQVSFFQPNKFAHEKVEYSSN